MCGRYALTKLADLLQLIPWLQAPADILERAAQYNVAPSQTMPIVTADAVRTAEWGFVPSWAKELPKMRPVNARAETASSGGMFRSAMAKRRCLVPADGFYEWKGSKPPKQPYLIRMRDGSPLAFAGRWDRWRPPEGEPVETFTILTTSPNELMATIHNRMPVIIPVARYRDWLEGDKATELLQSYPAAEMEAFPVSSRVNSPKNDVPECLVPLGGAPRRHSAKDSPRRSLPPGSDGFSVGPFRVLFDANGALIVPRPEAEQDFPKCVRVGRRIDGTDPVPRAAGPQIQLIRAHNRTPFCSRPGVP